VKDEKEKQNKTQHMTRQYDTRQLSLRQNKTKTTPDQDEDKDKTQHFFEFLKIPSFFKQRMVQKIASIQHSRTNFHLLMT